MPVFARPLPYALGLCATALAFTATAFSAQDAEACGCTSPPEPTSLMGRDFAVNQSAEQIIFEVNGDDTITAHVLIRYAGDPAAFAWIVPVPDTPTFDLSPATAFALLDRETAPRVFIGNDFVCPDPEYRCEYHAPLNCGETGDDGWGEESTAGTTGTGGSDSGGGGGPPDVNVEDQQVVGDYEVTTLSATSALELATWLNDNGYYTNDSFAPYMQSYLDAGMKFVAAKLLPGAGLDSIKPLRMTYPGNEPMIPLMLTAVAAEPHMPVVAYVYGDGIYEEKTHPMLDVDATQLERALLDAGPRENYPMLLSRIIDDANPEGAAFVREYGGPTPTAQFPDDSGCCGGGASDFCGLGNDGSCQCPRDSFDADDCAEIPELLESIDFLDGLAAKHTRASRIITRMSAEEMRFDPTFSIDADAIAEPTPLTLQHNTPSLIGCEPDIIDQDAYAELQRQNLCAATYCGRGGECGTTLEGAGCMCDENSAARAYTEYDGEISVTCVPKAQPVDLMIDPQVVDVCGGVDCGAGTCVELGGFPTCDCDPGAVAIVQDDAIVCFSNGSSVGDAGAQPYSTPIRDLEVCAPTPPTCGADGWLVPNPNVDIRGVACESSMPNPEDLIEPPAPTCDEAGESGSSSGDAGANDSGGGCSCSSDDSGPAPVGLAALMLGLLGVGRRRRRA